MTSFEISNLRFFPGPNRFLDCRAFAFHLYVGAEARAVTPFLRAVSSTLPALAHASPKSVADLFRLALMAVLRLDLDLFIGKSCLQPAGGEHLIAAEYLDQDTAEDAVYLVRDWFRALQRERASDFSERFTRLQATFGKTLYGGPTLYSLLEAAHERHIPVHYLWEENQFQWGYGRRQVRGRSTTFHTDSIKDTEFTMYKDMVKDFLLMCGFPTPAGRSCMREEQTLREAEGLGFPVVVKPVAGHKGQGVVTGIDDLEGVRKAFHGIVDSAREHGTPFDGAVVEKHISGTDHRLLAVNGRFAAALQRLPAFVDGNGRDAIEKLIETENATEARADTARSPLGKIKVDEDLQDFLKQQGRTLATIPAAGERVYLRRVANLSAGGVSINVSDRVHPANVKLVEDIAGFFKLTCLGIDVLARDISRPWTEGDFGIIEINAGPGVFMHLCPAIGGSVDVPGKIMEAHFPRPERSRIPIIAGNCLTVSLCEMLRAAFEKLRPGLGFGALTPDGVSFGGVPFAHNRSHAQNVKMLLRWPQLDVAAIHHGENDIAAEGMFHQGADIVVLDEPHAVEETVARDLLPAGALVRLQGEELTVSRGGVTVERIPCRHDGEREQTIMTALRPLLPELLARYE
ncbi:MAG: hypothetical protein KA072_01615 [Thermoanaerobaculaceae bacterium]|nr:hypothetical protein [Thermoanaerobaculaceae bacterium]MDI9620645.1 cyanophycin synthetase [Acidobacteriota bacterium]NLH10254.1 cyanophycin synthetase [Holophagae bacterium]HPW55289.1 hypothetical protein [Thermoanaerobaculaceae bacterium]